MQLNIEYQDNYQYHYGTANHMWQPYMQRIGELYPNAYFFIQDIGHILCTAIKQNFRWDQLEAVLDKNPIVVLSAHSEGPGWLQIASTVEHMCNHYNIDPRRIILWGGAKTVCALPIKSVITHDIFLNNVNESDVQQQLKSTHHFVMLGRIPRIHRIKAAVAVLARNLDSYGYMSCGCGYHGENSRAPYETHVPAQWQHRFPMLLDGYVDGVQQHIGPITMPEVTGAACNVILESSHEWNVPAWNDPFLTEKTEKCFLLKQLPIWIGARGQAEMARDLGFDLFDDLIDHSYDVEQNPILRLTMAIDQLERICSMPLEQLNSYKQSYLHRFNSNYNLCIKLKFALYDTQYQQFENTVQSILLDR